MKIETQLSKIYKMTKAILSRKFIAIQAYIKNKKRKISNKQPNFTTKGFRKKDNQGLVRRRKNNKNQNRSKYNGD